MAVSKRVSLPVEGTPAGCSFYYICDTIAELPATGLNVGDLATSLEGPKIYVAIDTTTWREITKASSTGYAGAGMLGSGTADSTKFLRGDQVWAVPPGGGGPATQIDSEGVTLDINAISDGQYLKRSGATVVGDAPAAAPHTHAQADVTNLTTDLAGKAASSHSHAISDVTNLQTSLDGKSDVGHTHAGGSDPWTMVVLESLFSTTNATNTNVTGLSFTPAANKRYVVECYFLLRTATATVGPRPGFSFPTGLTDGGAWMEAPTTATAKVFRSWGPLNTQNAASTGVPDTTNSHLALGGAVIICGASPSGNFQVTLASETAGTSVTMRVGSFIRYREI